jgi:YidC/Oxa1 family membrane protein insertase
MPIFLALFRVLDGVARTNDEGEPLVRGYWLQQNPDLVESLNQATIFGARISDTFLKVPLSDGISSVHVVTVVLIIAMTVTLFTTQLQLMRKNMPPEALTGPFAQQQKIMLYVFPLIFAIGGINFPVGVLIYWFTSNLWTMGQQFYVIRRNPAPGTPAYDAWEERRKARQKRRGGAEDRDSGEEPDAGGNGARPLAPVPGGSGTAAAAGPPRVVRQQPRKQSRSQRKR